ncbi:XopAF/AvrXv3 family type III secretion system effector [Xanthomonas fragariae]|uniref:XopAF/AvrXv3 family type III secretion system effector n=1 Tax=Xanthomonas fragariae TaxID=48664 RepID=UPI001E64663D|nr:XopAF/AvrXv3 family type III secretion system effector [Xanthomonas fragariae]MDM7555092.1 XopAF/AvrXv3 family type III secretion system effector [Xanthomonas fragariae]MDM7558226.1 XopAF/AvrXv3 family type III secretion system effector [Xanthomonas fragariae]MDM7575914.1 XopAF/AvrXv3 family type III secretion system effector [Xanthomonas fragariae]MDM7578978.1 XopAF/AvrXv3 family type III secretion system effector [Xanthomonas fragariae]MDM7589217.1 XopAF/AvrXv3 family type III secretion s
MLITNPSGMHRSFVMMHRTSGSFAHFGRRGSIVVDVQLSTRIVMGTCFSSTSATHGGGYSSSYNTFPSYTPAPSSPDQSPAPVNHGAFEGLSSRPCKVSHHCLPSNCDTLAMVPVGLYESARSHPGRPIKDRSRSAFPLIEVGGADEAHDDAFKIDNSTTVKVAGFNYIEPNNADTTHLYSTGTSQPNMPVMTDGMGVCIAVACAAERIDPTSGMRKKGAKARVFHVYPFARQDLVPGEALKSIQRYVDKTRQEQLTLRVAMHGGVPDNTSSLDTVRALRELFDRNKVRVELDQTCDNRRGDTPFGAVIRDDHSVHFITQLIAD